MNTDTDILLRVKNDDFQAWRLKPGDSIAVDRERVPRKGATVLCVLHETTLMGRIRQLTPRLCLELDPDGQTIFIVLPSTPHELWGVVTEMYISMRL
ncbi:MAG: hypothetical protein JWO97_3870 [Acidobacteria bacterium]|nr:hypothetical protein [Acidobacteriota bacterium]